MKYTPFKLNSFVLFKIPSAYISGVRVVSVTATKVSVGETSMDQSEPISIYVLGNARNGFRIGDRCTYDAKNSSLFAKNIHVSCGAKGRIL